MENWKDIEDSFGTDWIPYTVVKARIGIYSGQDRQTIAYFWSLIGNNYKKVNWKGDIRIQREIYKEVEKVKSNNLIKISGKEFLQTEFLVDRYKHKIVGTYIDADNDFGIYGIYKNGKLIYIGKTSKSFKERFNQHRRSIKNKDRDDMKLYSLIEDGDDIQFKPLISANDLMIEKGDLTERDLEAMELALIHVRKPIGNLQGVNRIYKFSWSNSVVR